MRPPSLAMIQPNQPRRARSAIHRAGIKAGGGKRLGQR